MNLRLIALDGEFAICRFEPHEPIPGWALRGPLVNICRTAEELSVLCEQQNLPDGTEGDRGWRPFRVAGELDFSEVGVLSCLADALARAGVSILAFSTFDTDYLLVKHVEWDRAVRALEDAGHRFLDLGPVSTS